MSRAPVISKLDNKNLVRLLRAFPDDPFFVVMPTGMFGALYAGGVTMLALSVGVWWFLLLAPLLVLIGNIGYAYANSVTSNYSHRQTYYVATYAIFEKITDPVDREAGKALLKGIWDHEQTYDDNSDHSDNYSFTQCDPCSKRKKLMGKLLKSSSSNNENADIKMVEDHLRIKSEVMKELGM